jgi:ABC-type sugar transport system substrate-binding protein
VADVARLARVPSGTPVVNIDSPIGADAAKQADLKILTYIGTDNVAAGGMAADTMAGLLKGGGKVGVIGGVSGDATSAARVEGFTKGAQGRFEPLETVAADWDRAKALNATEDLMRFNPDIKGFFAANDQMALGIGQAVKNAGKKGEIAIIGVDGIEDALKAVQSGDMSATVSQYPYHMNIEEPGMAAAIEAAGDRLGYFHVGESNRGPLGTGTVDFAETFAALDRIGYDGTITFESFSSAVVSPALTRALCIWRETWDDGMELATSGRHFVAQHLAAAAA